MPSNKWQQWLPLHIEPFKSSPYVIAMKPAARAGYLYLLMSAWESNDCELPNDEEELAILSGLGDEWSIHSKSILKCFFVNECGRLVNARLHKEWIEAQSIYSSRKNSASATNKRRSSHGDRDTLTLTDTLLSSNEESTLKPIAANPDEIVKIPCIRGDEYLIRQKEIDKFALVYPAIDCKAEILKAAMWIETHPANKKTVQGMPRFLNSWLSRAQNRAPSIKPEPPPKPERKICLDGEWITKAQAKERGIYLIGAEE